jgi:hypothetical protein
MMTLQPDPVPVSQSELERLFQLLAFVTNANAVADRMTALQQKFEESAVVIAEAEAATAELEKRQTAQDAAMKRASEDHAGQIAERQQAFDDECARRESDLQARSLALDAALARASADEKAAAESRVDLEARIAKIRAAAA